MVIEKWRSLFMLGSAIAIRLVGDRYLSNHHIVMVKMDNIVSGKRCWVS
ncbi:hypothetical protein [Argonema galeatum]|nr:hypothetical protein [Argonema galeatum]MCL1467618.1 hypothetical protein [Argonema galeatum A003/A1]